MNIEELIQSNNLELRSMYEDVNMVKELTFTDSLTYTDWFDNYLGFVNIREGKEWNNFSVGQINFMESLGANFDSAVFTWTLAKDKLNEDGS